MKIMLNMLGVLPVLVLLVHSVIGANKNGSFINPPQGSDYNPVYYVGQKLHIQWTTGIENPIYLQVWKTGTDQGKELLGVSFFYFTFLVYMALLMIIDSAQRFTSYGWTVSPVGNVTERDIYHFAITDMDNYDSWFSCHTFNITASNASTTATPLVHWGMRFNIYGFVESLHWSWVIPTGKCGDWRWCWPWLYISHSPCCYIFVLPPPSSYSC